MLGTRYLGPWLLSLLCCAAAHGQSLVPPIFPYQGVLKDAQGAPIDGTVDLTVALFSSEISPTTFYAEDHDAVAVERGVFSIEIGTGTNPQGTLTADDFATPNRWLEVTVDGEVMSPRQRMLSVPYAAAAENALRAGSAAVLGWKSVFSGLSVPANATGTVSVSCGDGYVVLGGGFSAVDVDAQLQQSYPSARNVWTVRVRNLALIGNSFTVNAWASCALDGGDLP